MSKRLPLTDFRAVRHKFDEASSGELDGPEDICPPSVRAQAELEALLEKRAERDANQ
jgi:hypothetical protein